MVQGGAVVRFDSPELMVTIAAIPFVLYGSYVKSKSPTLLTQAMGQAALGHEEQPRLNTSDALEQRIARAVKRVAYRLPGDHNCLSQAIAGQRMLSLLGRDSHIIVGLRKDAAANTWDAHAWLLAAGGAVVGGEIARNYAPVTRFRVAKNREGRDSQRTAEISLPSVLANIASRALSRELGIATQQSRLDFPQEALDLAKSQRIEGLVLNHLEALRVSMETKQVLQRMAMGQSMEGLRLVQNTAAVAEIFDRHDVPFLVFKGAALSLTSGRPSYSRGAGDIDLLIDQTDIPRAHSILIGEGFSPRLAVAPRSGWAWKFWAFRDRELPYTRGDVHVDLHWRIPQNPRHTSPTSYLLERKTMVTSKSSTFPSLSQEDSLNVCAAHVYLDYCQNLRQLCDLVYVSNTPNISLPADTPAAGKRLTADVLEFTRRILGADLVPKLSGVPQFSERGVRYMMKMWHANSSRSLLEAGPRRGLGEPLGRFQHHLRYGGSFVEISRFLAWAAVSIPKYEKGQEEASLPQAFGKRLLELMTLDFPYRKARASTARNRS